MSFSALASTLGCDVTDPTQTNLDDPVERELTYALFGIMPFDNCHHEGVINAMSNDNIDSTELCMVYRLYAVNNGEIPKRILPSTSIWKRHLKILHLENGMIKSNQNCFVVIAGCIYYQNT
eukprot:796722_1